MPNYLGIDYGTKRIGLAWMDELSIALPIGTVPGVEEDGCWDGIAEEIHQRKIDEIVVGYPVHMDGKIGKRAEEVDRFILELERRFHLPVHRIDERLTSSAAREAMGGRASVKGRDKTGRVDAVAASLILQDFGGS